MLQRFDDKAIEFSSDVSSVFVALYRQVFDHAYFHPKQYRSKLVSPFEHLRKKRLPLTAYPFFKRALDLCRNGLVHKLYGLTLIDLLSMDGMMLDYFEDHLIEITKEHNAALKDVKNKLDHAAVDGVDED